MIAYSRDIIHANRQFHWSTRVIYVTYYCRLLVETGHRDWSMWSEHMLQERKACKQTPHPPTASGDVHSAREHCQATYMPLVYKYNGECAGPANTTMHAPSVKGLSDRWMFKRPREGIYACDFSAIFKHVVPQTTIDRPMLHIKSSTLLILCISHVHYTKLTLPFCASVTWE